jgi:hypothetical protein
LRADVLLSTLSHGDYEMSSLKRKPLPSTPVSPLSGEQSASVNVSDLLDCSHESPPDEVPDHRLASKLEQLALDTRPSLPLSANTFPAPASSPDRLSATSTAATVPEAPVSSNTKSFWQTAVDETIHFAGGLLSHPFEATKHYSILRHSYGIVYYRGPSTSVTLTIFSDEPLPPNRSLWLQRKGFAGNMGMNASALLGVSDNWIDVTPTSEALASEVPERDERAWQRDMNKFLKKASKQKHLSKHDARETCVVRIPAVAADGYLRLVLCTGEGRKKVLCPSPVFRIASTSTDVSVLRGASLTTMPLEVGLKVASVVGTTTVNRYIAPARAVVDSRVQKAAAKVPKPKFVTTHAEHIAYAKSGLKDKFESLEQNFDHMRDVCYDALHDPHLMDVPPEVVGLDSGPQKPFPVTFDGTVVQETSLSGAHVGVPTAILSGVSSDLLLRLGGIYMGWASVQPKKGIVDVSHDWHEAIITIAPSVYASPSVVTRNEASVHMIHDFGATTFFGAKIKAMIMAPLRPIPIPDRTGAPSEWSGAIATDIDITLVSLSRKTWGPLETLQRIKTEKLARTTTEKYVEARVNVQKHVDSLPVHWAGVRTAGAEMIDRARGRGGYYIRR